jgi:hypothetical protein
MISSGMARHLPGREEITAEFDHATKRKIDAWAVAGPLDVGEH